MCVAAVDDATRCSTSLGHTVEDSAPAALDEAGLMDQFSAVMMSCLRADLAEIAEIAGRPLTADDVEPMTWLYYEASGGYDGGDVRARGRRDAPLDAASRVVVVRRRLRPPAHADARRTAAGARRRRQPRTTAGSTRPARSIPFAAYTAPFNVTGQPAMSVPLYWSDVGPARSACSSWRRRTAKTC